jgi:hypothetical protein
MDKKTQKTEPEPYSKFLLNLPNHLRDRLRVIAEEERRSLTAQVVVMLEEHPKVVNGNGKK